MKTVCAVAVLLMTASVTFAQSVGGSMGNKFYYGGGFSLGAGTNSYGQKYSYYSLFPVLGYRITPEFSMGTGVNYQHYSYPDFGVSYNQYGISPFARYNFSNLFFQTEYDAINSPTYDAAGQLTNTQFYSRLLFGIGWWQPFSEQGRGAINAMVMYDVLYRQPSVFNSPIVARVFVTF